MRLRHLVVWPIAAIACGIVIAYGVRNPERADLDAAARGGVPGKFVTLGDGVTHYDVAGPDTGQRVLLAHGFSVPSYIWDSTVTALTAAGFRVARYDYYGRGYSDRPDVPYTSDLFDRQMLQLLDSLGWREPVDIVGLSMGGPVTATFVGRHPDRARSLTLVDPAAGPADRLPLPFRLPVVGPVLWQTFAVPGMADGQFSDCVDPKRWPDWADRYRVQMRYRGFGRALRSTLYENSGRELDSVYARVGALGKPVLLIWGMQDSTVSIKNADGVRKAIPQAQYHPIDRAGHLPHMERTDVVNPLLVQFLRSVRSGNGNLDRESGIGERGTGNGEPGTGTAAARRSFRAEPRSGVVEESRSDR
jgi:pimeloyl-ACP methyl ester carboxylesterase